MTDDRNAMALEHMGFVRGYIAKKVRWWPKVAELGMEGDLEQEGFILLLEHLPEDGTLTGQMCRTIAGKLRQRWAHLCLSRQTRRIAVYDDNSHEEFSMDRPEFSNPVDMDVLLVQGIVRAIVSKLSDRQRRMLEKHLSGLDWKTISEEEGIDKKSARTEVGLGMRLIQKAVWEKYPDATNLLNL